MGNAKTDIVKNKHLNGGYLPVFVLFWLLTFILYLPAAKAGWVIDAAGWLDSVRNMKFLAYINRSQSTVPSLYQFTQFTTYLFYKLLGDNTWAWHTLQVTLHALNALLLYILCSRLFGDSNISKGKTIALCGVLLYCVSPNISEVIVWEASYHYLQGFLIILSIMVLVQKYHYRQKSKYTWIAGILFFLSTYSLEIFYLTPVFVLTLALYYRIALHYSKSVFKKIFFYFLIPEVILFLLYFLVFKLTYTHFAHISENIDQPLVSYLCKPPKYLFHVLFFGRYFPNEVRQKVYHLCATIKGLAFFYTTLTGVVIYIFARFRGMAPKFKVCVLFFVWTLLSVSILTPLAFPDTLLMFYDRYTYLLDAFTCMLLALAISFVANRYLQGGLLVIYGVISLYFTIKVNLYWKQSAYINNRLIQNLPASQNKILLLLNLPENMNGIPMIGAQPESEYRALHDLFTDKKINDTIYDVASYNMTTQNDGAHVTVINDSTLHVTLNQWGTWWWYKGHGGISYQNKDFRLNMVDGGHWYELTLKKPSAQYQLLYSVGGLWKIADMNNKKNDQY